MKLTRTQKELLRRLEAGEKIERGAHDQFRWNADGKTCSRTARRLHSARLIRCIFTTTGMSDVQLTEAGIRVLEADGRKIS